MSFKKINIPVPCAENFNKMKVCSEGLYCGVCQKHVIDFRKKQIEEIHETLENKKGEVCILVNQRYTEKSSRYQQSVNKIESFLRRLKMKKLGIAAATVLLFLGGCRTRHLAGAYAKIPPLDSKPGIENSVFKNSETVK